MIKLSGTLAIRTIRGSRGNFNVGRLVTDIGEFAVKDPLIEEYDEGRYEGDFGIAQISPSHYITNGRLVVEVRARIVSIALANIDELEAADHAALVEPDPVDQDVRSEPGLVAADVLAAAPGSELVDIPDLEFTPGPAAFEGGTDVATAAAEDRAHRDLFGELWPLADKVKLDPTVDRARFRQQRDALKALGYQFQPIGQAWVKS